jgi:hypothetical protein
MAGDILPQHAVNNAIDKKTISAVTGEEGGCSTARSR